MLKFEQFMQLYGVKKEDLPVRTKAILKDYNFRKKNAKPELIEEYDEALLSDLISFTKGMTSDEWKEFKKTGEKPDAEKEKAEKEKAEKEKAEKEKEEKEKEEKTEDDEPPPAQQKGSYKTVWDAF